MFFLPEFAEYSRISPVKNQWIKGVFQMRKHKDCGEEVYIICIWRDQMYFISKYIYGIFPLQRTNSNHLTSICFWCRISLVASCYCGITGKCSYVRTQYIVTHEQLKRIWRGLWYDWILLSKGWRQWQQPLIVISEFTSLCQWILGTFLHWMGSLYTKQSENRP